MLGLIKEGINTLGYLNRARDNMVAAWPKQFFRREFIKIKLLNKYVFVLNRPEDIQRVMVTNSQNYRKSLANRQSLKPILGQGLFVSEGKLWERQRKVMNPAVHRSRLAGYAEIMVKAAEGMIAQWKEREDGCVIDVSEDMTLLTSDIITRAMFGEELGPRNHELYEAFQNYLASHGRIHITELMGLPSWLPRPGQIKGRRAVRQFDTVIHSVIRQRFESKSEHSDLLQMLLDFHDDEGKPMSDELLRDEVASIYLAGHETTAITLSWAFYLLDCHPEAKQRILEEVEQVFGDERPSFESVQQLTFTRAVVDETLRMYPPVHVFSRQALGEDELSGERVPKGSFVTISSWVLHRHKLHWEDPDVFRPERFMPGNASKVRQFSYIPFGAGPRICLGKHFGLTETVLLLAMFVRGFEMTVKPGHEVEPLGKMTLRPSGGMPMVVKRRG